MEVPVGFLARLWSFISFLPFFSLLLLLGIIKAALIGPVVIVILFIGNSAVIIGLWPAHFIWTYYCLLKTKRLGLVLKILVLVCLPLPLILWSLFGILGSLLAGIGYGYFAPLIATFEAVGEDVVDKFYHCFANGCWSTIKGACTAVRDFADFCFHSYFSYMDDLREKIDENEMPMEIKLSKLPGCLLVGLLAIAIDVIAITLVALYKSPHMLLKGWQRLFEDLIGREGPFLETVCVPFAGLAIILWPIAVVGAVLAAFICSFFLALYAGVIVYQENSFHMGMAYIISVVSLFDEFTNDFLYLREGSRLPRPKYRNTQATPTNMESNIPIDSNKDGNENSTVHSQRSRLPSERSRTLKKALQQLKPIQIWDWLFRSCELSGRILLSEGLISVKDIEECIIKGKCKKLNISLPAWCLLQCLLSSAKSDSDGLVISDGVELTNFNWPNDKVLEWLLGPLMIMKEQIRGLQLCENEESCLRKLILTNNNDKPEDWDDTGFPSDDNVRRAQLQALLRRLQGIVASMSRMPTFRRRFNSLLKTLYLEALERGALSQDGTSAITGRINKSANGQENQKDSTNTSNKPDENCDIV